MEGLERARTKFLLYHDLARQCGGDKGMARERFRAQIQSIAEWGYSFRSMSEFLAGQASGGRDVVLTFDDGGRSFIDCALPVLEEFSATATMYVVAGFPGWHGRDMDFLDWTDIDALAERGIDIGSHALSHLPLVELSREEVRREIVRAADVFEQHELSPATFAYPYGRISNEVKSVVRECGFQAAFTIKRGGRDVFELRRRLIRLTVRKPVLRLYMQDAYFPVRKAVVSIVPEALRREGRPIPRERWGAAGFGIDGWTPPA